MSIESLYNSANETPVIFRKTKDGRVIALLPTIPIDGISTAIIAYDIDTGWFQSDTSIMHNTEPSDNVNTWPILSKLIQDEGIRPIRIVKRITEAFNRARLGDGSAGSYNALRA